MGLHLRQPSTQDTTPKKGTQIGTAHPDSGENQTATRCSSRAIRLMIRRPSRAEASGSSPRSGCPPVDPIAWLRVYPRTDHRAGGSMRNPELALHYRRRSSEEFGHLLTRVVSIGSLSQLLDCQHAASAAAPIRESLSRHAPRSFPSDCATVGGMTAMVYGARQKPAYRFFRRRKPASQSILRR